MKKIMQISLILAVITGFISVNAGLSSAAPKIYKFNFSSTVPSTGWGAVQTMKPWFKQVEEATNGQVTFQPYWSASLSKSETTWGALQSGLVDVAEVGFHYNHGLVVLHNVITLPFLKYESAEHEAVVTWKLYEKFQEIRDEYKDNQLLLFYTSNPFFFMSKKYNIKSRADLKGLKVRVVGGENLKKVVELAGGIPTNVPAPEIYMALDKGVIDVSLANFDMLTSYRLYEVGKYYFFGPFNAGARGVCMSKNAWNSLTPDLQQKIMSVSGLEGSRFWTRTTFDESEGPAREKVKSEGYELIENRMSEQKAKEWEELDREEIWNSWIKEAVEDAKAAGYSDPEGLVKRLVATTQELIESTRQEFIKTAQ